MINSPRTDFPNLKARPIFSLNQNEVLANAKMYLANKIAAEMNAFLSNYEFSISQHFSRDATREQSMESAPINGERWHVN